LPAGMQAVADQVADQEADLRLQAESIRAAGLDRTMGIVEWNYGTRSSHNDHAGFFEPNDIRHCLYAAGYLNAFCRMGEILEVANFYSLINTMGIVHVHAGQVRMSDVVKVFNLYAPALPGEVLELELDAPALSEKSRMLDACFLRTPAATYGFLLNFHASETAVVTMAGLGAVREASGLSATEILQPVADFEPVVDGATVTLPPMSLVRVTMTGK
jgi:hypothetical protein